MSGTFVGDYSMTKRVPLYGPRADLEALGRHFPKMGGILAQKGMALEWRRFFLIA